MKRGAADAGAVGEGREMQGGGGIITFEDGRVFGQALAEDGVAEINDVGKFCQIDPHRRLVDDDLPHKGIYTVQRLSL